MLKTCKTAPLDSARGEELSLFFMVSEVEPSSLQRKNEFFSILLGQTDSGRYLSIYFIYKLNKYALVVSAREMNPKERRRYASK